MKNEELRIVVNFLPLAKSLLKFKRLPCVKGAGFDEVKD